MSQPDTALTPIRFTRRPVALSLANGATAPMTYGRVGQIDDPGMRCPLPFPTTYPCVYVSSRPDHLRPVKEKVEGGHGPAIGPDCPPTAP